MEKSLKKYFGINFFIYILAVRLIDNPIFKIDT